MSVQASQELRDWFNERGPLLERLKGHGVRSCSVNVEEYRQEFEALRIAIAELERLGREETLANIWECLSVSKRISDSGRLNFRER